ncbi:MAG: hypothetical protein L0Y36_09780 [Planctomycetales bacterium]|nr:hypothetical protein [Planctomycetales bacterium]
METYWNKKRIGQLFCADSQTLEELLLRFGPAVYTWLYYHVGADPQTAAELTGLAFRQALLNMPHFEYRHQTLFQWIRNHTKQTLAEGLAGRPIQPQRPWAWSNLPPQVLHTLSCLRSEAVPESVASNPFVQELVQAALAELDPGDCELMRYRYHHLDMPEHIAEQLGISIEEVNSRLYRCRHSFRREFVQLICSVNLGFSESSAPGGIEILDGNLEKLLSATEMHQTPTPAQLELIRSRVLEAADELARNRPEPKPLYRFAVILSGAALILVIGIIAAIFYGPASPKSAPEPPIVTTAPPTNEPDKKTAQPAPPKQNEIMQIFELGRAGRIDALLEILKSGQLAEQIAAVHFIGKLADESVIALLEQAELQRYPDGPDDNPFAQAIDAILSRFPEAASPAARPAPTPAAPEPNKPTPKPAILRPAATGTVTDSSGQPVAGAHIELLPNPLFSATQMPTAIANTQTDPNGHYQLVTPYEGAVFVTCKGTPSFTRAAWCVKDTACVVNFGGKPSVTGALTQQDAPFANQPLVLSDTLDWTNASFRAETTTNEQGNFSVAGVPPGTYYLLHRQPEQKLSRLAVFEVPSQSDFHLSLDIRPVSITLNYPLEPGQPAPAKAVLTYGSGLPEGLLQTPATIQEKGLVRFESVIPGSYLLNVQLDTGVWIQQEIDVSTNPVEQILVNPPLQETVTLFGRLLNPAPASLFLDNANRHIRIDLTAGQDGSYELASVPADIYGLAAYFHGQRVEFAQIDLQNQSETAFDIDPKELMKSLCPLYVVVTDARGLVLSGAQVWLAGNEHLIVAQSTGRGTFLAAPAGSSTLSAAYPGYLSYEQTLVLKPSELSAKPDSANTIHIRLGNPAP